MTAIDPKSDVEYFVAFKDDGSFRDLLRSDVNGLFFRTEAQSWVSAPPEYLLGELDGSDIIEVADIVVDIVDASRKPDSPFGITLEEASMYPPEDE